jgi:ectoine hydroxylase-related dioxygenase (phytanoyl-CoA dioxygenase family)
MDNFTNSLALAEDDFDPASARDVEVEGGQVIVFDVRLIHGARANLGTKPRAGYALRFMPSSVHYDQKWAAREPERFAPNTAKRPLFLVRGVDRSGLNSLQ